VGRQVRVELCSRCNLTDSSLLLLTVFSVAVCFLHVMLNDAAAAGDDDDDDAGVSESVSAARQPCYSDDSVQSSDIH